MLFRVATAGAGVLLIVMSAALYETEEGMIQNKLEQWWVVLSDAEPRAVRRHIAFVRQVASLTNRVFDQLFGTSLFSTRSVAVSACFSLASLGLVCSPGLSTAMLAELPVMLYYPIVVLLLVMGVLPSVLGPRWPARTWFVGVGLLTFLALAGMDAVNWFNLVYVRGESAEFLYDLAFVLVTVGSDTLFIAATRWLLRRSATLESRATILGLMFANVSLACVLVAVPVAVAWGGAGVEALFRAPNRISAIEYYASTSGAGATFLSTLAASNVLDGAAACAFFFLWLLLLLHRLAWPILQRPVYALASRGIVRRRRLLLVIGVALVGIAGTPKAAVDVLRKLLAGL